MKTLVTGATGFLGSAIVRELISDGRDVKILVRNGADLKNVEGLEVEPVVGDLRDLTSLEKALDGCDVLYHVAAHYSFWDRDKRSIYDINVGGTEKILNAALKKNLEKVIEIILEEIKLTLKRNERVELRGFGVFYSNLQKARISRNPKTGEKVNTPEKKTIHFKMSKDLFKILNDQKK